jgi:HlyD family secretion protein
MFTSAPDTALCPISPLTRNPRGLTRSRLMLLTAGGAISLVVVSMLLGLGNRPQPAGANPKASGPASPPPVQPAEDDAPDTARAQRMSFEISTVASGELEALRQVELRSQIEQDTAITEIVREGVQVKAGDVILRLNSDTIQTQIDEESLRVETARAEFASAENNYLIQVSDNESEAAKALLTVELAELELRQWLEGEVKSKRQANDLAFEKAVRELDRLKEKYQRSVVLEKQGFLSRDELKRDEVQYLEAQAALKTAELDRQVYDDFQFPKDQKTKQSAVDQAKAELDRTKRQGLSQLATKEAERNNKRTQLFLREQKLAKLREQLEATTIRAPSDGLVVYATSVNRDRWGNNNDGTLDVGRIVKRNTPLIILPDTSEMVASVRVHESLTGRIRKGQPTTVKIDALGGRTVPGEVLSVGVIAESGGMRDPNLREYTVKIKLDMAAVPQALKPSMRCEAEILLDRVTDRLAIPIQSVFTDGMVRYVLTPEGNRFRKTPVRLGRRSERLAEVSAGIAENTPVLLRAPMPGELIERPWEKDELAAVGLNLRPDGRIEPMGPPPGAEGGRPMGPRAGGASQPVGGAAPGAPSPADDAQDARRERSRPAPPSGTEPASPASNPAPTSTPPAR